MFTKEQRDQELNLFIPRSIMKTSPVAVVCGLTDYGKIILPGNLNICSKNILYPTRTISERLAGHFPNLCYVILKIQDYINMYLKQFRIM